MAYTTIKKPSDYFNTKLYTGNSSTNAQTGVGFQPDWVWIKGRNQAYNHYSFDAVRGVNKSVYPNGSGEQVTHTDMLMSFDSDGFTLGSDSDGSVNGNGDTFASWNWLANGTGSSNTDGSRTTTVSANTTSGFSVGTCTSLATNNDTLGHGLGVVPKMIMVKNTASNSNWFVYHASLGNTDSLYLNTTGSTLGSTIWNNTTPTSSVFTMKGGDFATGESLVFYAFADVQGYSKFGSYIGNSSTDGTFVYTGFKPAFVILKRTDGDDSWVMLDNKRNEYNPEDKQLLADTSGAETTQTQCDFLSNGFKLRIAGGLANGNGNNHIYMAFAEQPLVGDNPATAR